MKWCPFRILFLVLHFTALLTITPQVVAAGYVGPASSCMSGWCSGTGRGSCFTGCHDASHAAFCTPTGSRLETWTCETSACLSAPVTGCGSAVTCQWVPTGGTTCANCSGHTYRECGDQGPGCYLNSLGVYGNGCGRGAKGSACETPAGLSLIHISEPTRH